MESATEKKMIPRIDDESHENSSETKKIDEECNSHEKNDTKSIEGESLSKRQLKKIQKKEKWLERKGEKRLTN